MYQLNLLPHASTRRCSICGRRRSADYMGTVTHVRGVMRENIHHCHEKACREAAEKFSWLRGDKLPYPEVEPWESFS